MSVWMCVWSFLYIFLFFAFLFLCFWGDLCFWGKVVDISCRDGILIHGFNDWKCYTLMYEYIYRCDTAWGIRELFPGGNLRGGKHSKLRSPFFPLALPLSGHAFWSVRCGVWYVIDGAMDSTVSGIQGWADGWGRTGKAARIAGLFPDMRFMFCDI